MTINGNLANIINFIDWYAGTYLMLTFSDGIIKSPDVGSQVRVGSQGPLD